MSDKDNSHSLPPFLEADWHGFVHTVVGLVSLGVVDIQVHPSRWRLITEAAQRFGDGIPKDVDIGEVISLPIDLDIGGHAVRAWIRRWEPCPRPLDQCPHCARLLAQTYPAPEDAVLDAAPEDGPAPRSGIDTYSPEEAAKLLRGLRDRKRVH